MRVVYIGVELSNGFVFCGFIKIWECNFLMKDLWEYVIVI